VKNARGLNEVGNAQPCFPAAQAFVLSHGLSWKLRLLSEREQAPLPLVLTAALAALVYRYTGQEDLLVRVTALDRPPLPTGSAAGRFGSTAVLRADVAGDPSVRELLSRIRAAHKAVSPRDLAANGLQAGATNCDLSLEVSERAQALGGRFICHGGRFEPETARWLIGHWPEILEEMAAEPWRPVGRLPLLANQEKKRLLADWSAGPALSEGPDLAQAISERANAQPNALAVVCAGERLSYGQLNRRANQLARYLLGLGVGAEVPVGVGLERSLDQIIALVGILKAGGAYVPVDPEGPAERIRYVMRDTKMPLLLAQARLRRDLENSATEVVSLDQIRALIDRQPPGELAVQPAPEQLAYVIYTSGSTGQPKGVMVERGTITAHSWAMVEEYKLEPADRVLQFSHYSFDASLEQILPALAAGAPLVMRGPEIWSPRELLEEIRQQRVTVMNLPPAYWHQAVREWARAPHGLAATQLRLVIVGGDRLGAHAVRQWRELGLPGVRLVNAYGPTETTITATLAEVGTGPESITIGRPLAGRKVYILDRDGQPVPPGVLGELHIGGELLARGYLNQPGLTKERFVSDPFGGHEAGRLYRTGDLARFLADGRIEYVGRLDHQVKIRGYRIELGEIEAALAQHPAVDEAVVATLSNGDDKQLVAYVASQGGPVPEEELRGHLRETLPSYMRPAVIVQLGEMPRLASGKPDRRSLPEVEPSARKGQQEYVAPRGPAERELVQIWEELLESRPIGIRDHFLDLGGHSLLAVQLAGRIEHVYGRKLQLSTLFANPTVEQLAAALDGEEGRGRARVLPVQTDGNRTPFFFLHGDWTGAGFHCVPLARACGPEQPFYRLEPYVFSAREGAPTFEVIARAHIDAMRAVQPRGPYRLGGYCNGGLLAYEMARQLEAEGEQTEFLGLVTPSPPMQTSILRAVCDWAHRATRADRSRRADLFLRARHALRHVYRHLLPHGSRARDFGQLLAIDPRLGAMFPPRDALYNDYIGVFHWAVTGYKTGTFAGKITLFWARQETEMYQAWRPIVEDSQRSGSEERLVTGALISCITRYVQELAESLAESLGRTD
jgi:amino acid adenylation domain-containing protein